MMTSFWSRCGDVLVGKRVPGSDRLPNPLMRPKSDNSSLIEAIPADIIVERAEKIISHGLQHYGDDFRLAAELVNKKLLWQDPALRSEAASPRKMTDAEYDNFKRDQGSTLQKLLAQPWAMWQVILLCGLGAMVQGWDEAAVNGAQVYYQVAYNFQRNDSRVGWINGAPYACCFISCWLSWPLNKFFGRRVTIFLAALCSFAFALGQAFANDWTTMLILRVFLGFGIGPKSATIPIYASEIAPAELRGALVMMWQLFTALGIMFGYLSGVVFADKGYGNDALYHNPPCSAAAGNNLLSLDCSVNWRLMIGSPMVAPIILCLYILLQPESPRWLIARAQRKERHNERVRVENSHLKKQWQKPDDQLKLEIINLEPVFSAMVRLRGGNKLKAARDMLIIDVLLSEQKKRTAAPEQETLTVYGTNEILPHTASSPTPQYPLDSKMNGVEKQLKAARKELGTLFRHQRNRNALLASSLLMFLQQFCGINVLIYYSTLVLFQTTDNGTPVFSPGSTIPRFIVDSSVVGAMNFVFGLPAIFLIDTRGRRSLLLRTFPLLAIFSMFVAIGSADTTSQSVKQPLTLAGMYLFVIFYSPGEGPVPFVYAAESFPQDIRDLGMALVTSLNWLLNFTVAVSFPSMSDPSRMNLYGTFAFYSVWCFIGWILILFLVPETCRKELEKLDQVFDKTLSQLIKDNLRSTFSTQDDIEQVDDGEQQQQQQQQRAIQPNNEQEHPNSLRNVESYNMPNYPQSQAARGVRDTPTVERVRDTSPVGSPW